MKALESPAKPASSGPGSPSWLSEWPLLPGLVSAALFLALGKGWLADLQNAWWAVFLFVWLFAAILISAFAVVRHADCLAIKLGEPYGTLILTLAVIGMEVMMVAAVMLSGQPDPGMARDTMFAVVMIVLNGLAGTALLVGGWRHREQQYNLQGAVAFLSMLIPLAVFGLVLPYYSVVTSEHALFKFHAWVLVVMTVGLYGAFLTVQTRRHPDYFVELTGKRLSDEAAEANEHGHLRVGSLPFHAALLLISLVPVVLLSKKLAVVLEYGAHRLGAPQALIGMIVAILILCPEGVAGVRAALGNRLQRAVNLLYGAALSTIALTVPAVLLIGLATGKQVDLGLSPANQILLVVTLIVCMLTCTTGRTNVLNGLVHLMLFLGYIMLVLES